MRPLVQVIRVLLGLLGAVSLTLAGRVAYVGYGPSPGAATLTAQTRYLDAALAGGAGRRMQRLFPEGDFFTTVLTSLAQVRQPEIDLPGLRNRLAALDSPEMTEPFGRQLMPEHGIFHAGWTLLLAAELARRSGDEDDREALGRRADTVARAISQEPSGFPVSYPGQRWPCDAVVAAAALARAEAVAPTPAWQSALRQWRTTAVRAREPSSGLLPHRVDERGRPLEPPRGSSQAIIQTFWPDVTEALDGQPDLGTWLRFRQLFVTRRVGLVGVREYLPDRPGTADVDSGPLIFGVSASASVVGLAAARRVGDAKLVGSLDREAELLGAGLTLDGRRRYAFGLLPVGDAFLAWARSQSHGAAVPSGSRSTAWPFWISAALAPGALAAAGLAALRRRRRVHRTQDTPV